MLRIRRLLSFLGAVVILLYLLTAFTSHTTPQSLLYPPSRVHTKAPHAWTKQGPEHGGDRHEASERSCQSARTNIAKLLADSTPEGNWTSDLSGCPISGSWRGWNRVMPGTFTYPGRYAAANASTTILNGLSHTTCNAILRESSDFKTAITYRIHPKLKWGPELVLALRALIVELGWSRGYDIYLLRHIKSDHPKPVFEVPEEFRHMVLNFTWEDISAPYSKDIERSFEQHFAYPLAATNQHLAQVWFSRLPQGKQYDYFFMLENDVRSTTHWHTLVDDIFSQWRQVTSNTSNSTRAHLTWTNATTRLERPDLITMTVVDQLSEEPNWIWKGRMSEFWPAHARRKTLLPFHGLSKALVSHMHDTLKRRKNAYFEAMAPTVAADAGLRTFIYAVAQFRQVGSKPILKNVTQDERRDVWYGNLEGEEVARGSSYFHVDWDAADFYHGWVHGRSADLYRPATIVHPYKDR